MDALPDIMTGRLAFDVVAQGQDDFGDGLGAKPLLQRGQIKVFRSDTVDGRKTSMQDVVRPTMRQGTLKRHEVRHLLNDAKRSRVALRVATDLAERGLGEAATAVAAADALGGGFQRGQQGGEFSRLFDQKVQRDPFRGAMAKAGELAQQLADFLEGRRHERVQSPGKENPAVAFDISAS